jgi:glycine hydroxymethyltransferase
MKEPEMEKIVDLIDSVLMNKDNDSKIKEIKEEVNSWMKKFPLYK